MNSSEELITGVTDRRTDENFRSLPELDMLVSDILGETGKDRSVKIDRDKVKTIITATLAALAMCLIAFLSYEATQMYAILDSVNYISKGVNFNDTQVLVSDSSLAPEISHSDETKNILLLGVDVDRNGTSRSDSMIILTIDHHNKKIKMTSLMRDMYLSIPGHSKNKFNASYSFGGGDLVLRTIYANFGLKIDNYVCVDYTVFSSVVDRLGGVEIEIEEMELEQFNKYVAGGKKNYIEEAGTYNMNGKQALSYCRIRKVGSDTMRTARQRKVLKKIVEKCRKLSLSEMQSILKVVAPLITTNFEKGEIMQMALEAFDSRNYETMALRIPMDGAWSDLRTDNGWYVEVDLNRNARYLNQFIYGDIEKAQELSDKQTQNDDERAEHTRSTYSKKKKK